MVVQSIAATILAPVHLLVYSTFLGTQLYQSFVMVKVAHQALPLEAFTLFQKRAFFVYFRAQSILLVLTVATFPPTGPIRLAKSKGDLVPLLIGGITALLNWMVFGPRTSRDMMMRRFQRGIKNSTAPISEREQRVNQAFSRNHALSVHTNLITIGATLWYGWKLASRLKFNSE